MMSDKKFYIAGMGMVTPVGANLAMTAAAVNAGISGYKLSHFLNATNNPVTMALVPWQLFEGMEMKISEGDRFNEQHDHIIRMAILAVLEACKNQQSKAPTPLLLAMPDAQRNYTGLASLTQNLAEHCAPYIDPKLTRALHSGRAAGVEAIDFAFNYLHNTAHDFVLIGGSDSHIDDADLYKLDGANRLLSIDNPNGFAPGEGASFLLLTTKLELAQVKNNKVVALRSPGIAEEEGHLHSEAAYRGDGLDKAFKKALAKQPEKTIHSIFSSMNGEHFWAKELGVAQIRNKKYFADSVNIKHPADCYGDLGSASATTLIALAAEDLYKNAKAKAHLVYSSSDSSKRSAIVVEKRNALANI